LRQTLPTKIVRCSPRNKMALEMCIPRLIKAFTPSFQVPRVPKNQGYRRFQAEVQAKLGARVDAHLDLATSKRPSRYHQPANTTNPNQPTNPGNPQRHPPTNHPQRLWFAITMCEMPIMMVDQFSKPPKNDPQGVCFHAQPPPFPSPSPSRFAPRVKE
jgi:hypothetical protein